MTSVVAFIIVIGILIVIHELGHFVVARLFGVGVERFSIGFGPVLWRYRGKETEYCVSLIPMGGYVKMMGDDENPLEGGARPARDFPLLARAYLDGTLKLDELISRHIALDEINDGFAALQRGETIRSVVMF